MVKASQLLLAAAGLAITLGVGAKVHADVTGGNRFFPTTLYPPGYTAHVQESLKVQSVKGMPRVTDRALVRQVAAQVASALAANQPALSALGKQIFFDTRLSTPAGQSCASCHDPQAGFTYPESQQNLIAGPVQGAVAGRFGKRIPPSISYSVFSPIGPFYDPDFSAYTGGQFWDGRSRSVVSQMEFPLQDPNEMNNTMHNMGDPQLIVQKLASSTYALTFQKLFGPDIFLKPAKIVLACAGQAISAYEQSPEVIPFSSKYDYFRAGRVGLTASELRGLQLFTGSVNGRPDGPAYYKNAQCATCHGIPDDPSSGPDIFSNFCYANIGIPKNPRNPFYVMTDAATNPLGYNPQGSQYVDLGLGDFLYPAAGLPPGNNGNDFVNINGTFKAPSLRNIDKRPYPRFTKAFMHNGSFKSLRDIVHFYNTRNLTTVPGEVIDFSQDDPYGSLKGTPLWPMPEYIGSTITNATGDFNSSDANVGNLGLTPSEEGDLVAFLRTLSDGWDGH